jgi:hypothetical protein
MSLFSQLSGFQFPDVLMNSGPLPSTAGGPAGSDGSIDGVIKMSGRVPKPDEVKAWLQ